MSHPLSKFRLLCPLVLLMPFTPLLVAETLVGSWETTTQDSETKVEYSLQLDLKANQTFEVAIQPKSEIVMEYPEDIPKEVLQWMEKASAERIRLASGLEYIEGNGTWETKSDSLLLHYETASYVVRGESLAAREYLLPILYEGMTVAITTTVLWFQVTAETTPAEMVEMLEESLAEVLEDPVWEEVMDMLGELLDEEPLPLLMSGTFALKDDLLSVTVPQFLSEEGETFTLEFWPAGSERGTTGSELGPTTAIQPMTWGWVKNQRN